MSGSYVNKKAAETARAIVNSHGIDLPTALNITRSIWQEAQRCILKAIDAYGADRWQMLSASEKAAVCTVVVKGLLDRERVLSFMASSRKSIV